MKNKPILLAIILTQLLLLSCHQKEAARSSKKKNKKVETQITTLLDALLPIEGLDSIPSICNGFESTDYIIDSNNDNADIIREHRFTSPAPVDFSIIERTAIAISLQESNYHSFRYDANKSHFSKLLSTKQGREWFKAGNESLAPLHVRIKNTYIPLDTNSLSCTIKNTYYNFDDIECLDLLEFKGQKFLHIIQAAPRYVSGFGINYTITWIINVSNPDKVVCFGYYDLLDHENTFNDFNHDGYADKMVHCWDEYNYDSANESVFGKGVDFTRESKGVYRSVFYSCKNGKFSLLSDLKGTPYFIDYILYGDLSIKKVRQHLWNDK